MRHVYAVLATESDRLDKMDKMDRQKQGEIALQEYCEKTGMRIPLSGHESVEAENSSRFDSSRITRDEQQCQPQVW